ncbi:hypothetical protein LQW54_004402 [Pestalotiopsis sp. IQ-011]
MTTPNVLLTTFHYLPKLPPELRLKVWEETWPEARIIEVTCGESLQVDTYENMEDPPSSSLRPICTLSRWTQEMRSGLYRDFEDEKPLEPCRNPIALYISHESRAHTLRHFIMLEHQALGHSFYIDPQVDILWLSEDASDDPSKLNSLQDSYSDQLNTISSISIEEADWDEREYLLDFFDILEGLLRAHIIIAADDQRDESNWMQMQYKDLLKASGKQWKIEYKDIK